MWAAGLLHLHTKDPGRSLPALQYQPSIRRKEASAPFSVPSWPLWSHGNTLTWSNVDLIPGYSRTSVDQDLPRACFDSILAQDSYYSLGSSLTRGKEILHHLPVSRTPIKPNSTWPQEWQIEIENRRKIQYSLVTILSGFLHSLYLGITSKRITMAKQALSNHIAIYLGNLSLYTLPCSLYLSHSNFASIPQIY